MLSVGIKELKNKLSEYLRLVATGETVLVTDRNQVVAELGPPGEGRSPFAADAMLAEAVRKGWITPPVLPSSDPPKGLPVMTWKELRKGLQSDRADR